MDQAADSSAGPDRSSHGERRGSRRLSPIAIGIGMLLGVVLSLYVASRYFGESLPPITSEAFVTAQQQWREAGVEDYRIEVVVRSRQTERYAVVVRDGEPVEAWRNGRPLKQQRVFDTWSVLGMFDTIASDLDRVMPGDGSSVGGIVLRGEFDKATGAPIRYHRIEWGTDLEVRWEIVALDALEGDQSRGSLLAIRHH